MGNVMNIEITDVYLFDHVLDITNCDTQQVIFSKVMFCWIISVLYYLMDIRRYGLIAFQNTTLIRYIALSNIFPKYAP